MLPTQSNYQHFVPDQLLTSDHLNQLFEYLDEQGRLTRTNLIGIGIVCGLEVKLNAAGTALAITKGCGVTSEGYLVSVPEITYTHYKSFNAVKDRIYGKFVDNNKQQRFPLDELMQAGVEEGTVPLTKTYLNNKVVLIFVEILEEAAKNCNPNSCDDKGVNVTVSFKPLLINKSDVETLLANNNGGKDYLSLPEIVMRRFDAPATNMLDTTDIFTAYQKILNAAFIQDVQQNLTDTYNTISPLISDIYSSNPFSSLSGDFKFLHDGSIDKDQLVNYQYYYDLFSDLIYAYDELREVGMELISMCCPDGNLFPRHLVLDLAVSDIAKHTSDYRQYFIPSPVMKCSCHQVNDLRQLFVRLVLLLEKYFVPPVGSIIGKNKQADTKIRITPSKLGDIALSKKAIPYYYKVNDASGPLYKYWSPEQTKKGTAHKILSYHAKEYNTTDDHVVEPLPFDLKPYNFLRIEGHIGKPFTHALSNIISLRNKYRLPFDVIALSSDVRSLRTQMKNLENVAANRLQTKGVPESLCQFQDLETLYKTLTAELICTLCKEMQFLYNLPGSSQQLPTPQSTIPQVTLLKRCAPNFRFTANSFGHQFELFFTQIKNAPYVSADAFLANFNFNFAAVNTNQSFLGFALLYYMEKLSETLVDALENFDFSTFNTRYNDLIRITEVIKQSLQNSSTGTTSSPITEDLIDHLDVLLGACKQTQFSALYKEFLRRKLYVLLLQKFGYFVRMHPGIQHKAGVPIGGTFILVYHESEQEEETGENIVAGNTIGGIADTQKNIVNSISGTSKRSAASSEKAGFSSSGEKENIMSTQSFETSASKLSGNFTIDSAKEFFSITAAKSTVISEELIEEIGQGSVIADFYLPYLCYSDCPPIHFTVKAQDPEPDASIGITPKEFCSDDKGAYSITVSPEGGTVSGEGVTKDQNGKSFFNPSAVQLGTAIKKTVELTYSVDGGSATVSVTVYAKPFVSFTSTPGTASPTLVIFKSNIQNAESFVWDFGDGSTSTAANPTHDFKQNGTYTVVLKATNGVCSAQFSDEITIGTSTPQKTCLSSKDLIANYKLVSTIDSDNFPSFTKLFPTIKEVDAYYSKLQNVLSLTVDEQIKFFIETKTPDLLSKWLQELNALILESSQVRLIALMLYQVLVELAMYVACIQKEDISGAQVRMDAVFKLIQGQLSQWTQFVANFSAEQKARIKLLLEAIDTESERLVLNNEQSAKPNYAIVLSKCIEIIEKYPL